MKISIRLLSALLVAELLAIQTTNAECNDNITPSTPTSRFTINDNGTVTDTQTGLMWMRCSLGQTWDGATCTGETSIYTWRQALSASTDNNFAGFGDWYLPNIKELASIAELSCYNPAINLSVFPGTPSTQYWSSSPIFYDRRKVWIIFFYNGEESFGSSTKDSKARVRLVRVGVAQ